MMNGYNIWQYGVYERLPDDSGSRYVSFTVDRCDDGDNIVYVLKKDGNPISITAVRKKRERNWDTGVR